MEYGKAVSRSRCDKQYSNSAFLAVGLAKTIIK